MVFISTNSHVCVHKLCLLCVRSQEFNSRGITAWAEGEKDEKHSLQGCTSSNLKGKSITKTIRLHWLQQVTKHVPTTDEASVHRTQLRVKSL